MFWTIAIRNVFSKIVCLFVFFLARVFAEASKSEENVQSKSEENVQSKNEENVQSKQDENLWCKSTDQCVLMGSTASEANPKIGRNKWENKYWIVKMVCARSTSQEGNLQRLRARAEPAPRSTDEGSKEG